MKVMFIAKVNRFCRWRIYSHWYWPDFL